MQRSPFARRYDITSTVHLILSRLLAVYRPLTRVTDCTHTLPEKSWPAPTALWTTHVWRLRGGAKGVGTVFRPRRTARTRSTGAGTTVRAGPRRSRGHAAFAFSAANLLCAVLLCGRAGKRKKKEKPAGFRRGQTRRTRRSCRATATRRTRCERHQAGPEFGQFWANSSAVTAVLPRECVGQRASFGPT
jgi:hypothetical protein